jgi:uncharacterized SAM-dependent methyltransferase
VSFTTSRLYDGRGFDPFEEITRIEEYYPTPVETVILRACQPELRQLSSLSAAAT